MALWQLGLMYESGEGVEKDPVKAFGYFSQIANEHADAAPRGRRGRHRRAELRQGRRVLSPTACPTPASRQDDSARTR